MLLDIEGLIAAPLTPFNKGFFELYLSIVLTWSKRVIFNLTQRSKSKSGSHSRLCRCFDKARGAKCVHFR